MKASKLILSLSACAFLLSACNGGSTASSGSSTSTTTTQVISVPNLGTFGVASDATAVYRIPFTTKVGYELTSVQVLGSDGSLAAGVTASIDNDTSDFIIITLDANSLDAASLQGSLQLSYKVTDSNLQNLSAQDNKKELVALVPFNAAIVSAAPEPTAAASTKDKVAVANEAELALGGVGVTTASLVPAAANSFSMSNAATAGLYEFAVAEPLTNIGGQPIYMNTADISLVGIDNAVTKFSFTDSSGNATDTLTILPGETAVLNINASIADASSLSSSGTPVALNAKITVAGVSTEIYNTFDVALAGTDASTGGIIYGGVSVYAPIGRTAYFSAQNAYGAAIPAADITLTSSDSKIVPNLICPECFIDTGSYFPLQVANNGFEGEADIIIGYGASATSVRATTLPIVLSRSSLNFSSAVPEATFTLFNYDNELPLSGFAFALTGSERANFVIDDENNPVTSCSRFKDGGEQLAGMEECTVSIKYIGKNFDQISGTVLSITGANDGKAITTSIQFNGSTEKKPAQ